MTAVQRVTRFGAVNGYLVREDDGLTLIDTLVPRSTKAVLAAAEGLGAPIVRIVITHAHADHVGSLDDLVERLPDAEVICSAREAPILAGDMSLEPDEPDDKLRGGYPKVRTRPRRTVEAGERVGSLEVVATPGHTPGHIALFDGRDRTVYCGDVFSTLGGIATSAKPRLPLPLAFFSWHRPTVLESARRLRALDPDRLAPGHGRVIERPADAMDRAIARGATGA